MPTFKDVLLEKVSKLEITDALNNPNVLIGAEFEFKILPFLERYKKFVNRYDKANDLTSEFLEYEEALERYAEDPDNNEMPNLPPGVEERGYDMGDDLPDVLEVFPELKINTKMLFDKLIREFIPLKKLPFKNYMISPDAHAKTGPTQWAIKPDGSLGLAGVEIVTPVLPLKEFLSICPKVFEFISNDIKGSEVGEDCGFHLSISLKNIPDLSAALDITKLSLFTDEGYIYNFFKTREYNTYARSAHTAVHQNMIKIHAPKLATQLVDEPELKRAFSASHYMAINIEHLETANKYIEFRYVGGQDYHRKWDKIRSILAHYIHDLSLACDTTWKMKEYQKKLQRLINKVELFTVVIEMNKMLIDDPDSYKTKEFKGLLKSWHSVKMYKDEVDKDLNGTGPKKGFEKLCIMLGVNPNKLQWDFSEYRVPMV